MQTTYAQKNETTQRAADNTAAAVHDNSPQSECLQRHASLANAAVQRAENPPRPNNTGLPDDLKNGVESLSGYSLDNVRVHYNSPKPATVQALAYTQGTDIHVAPGQEHALPHEAWHVTQQMAGRVTPTTNIGGMPVNDNAALEHEADVMGEKAVTQRKVDGGGLRQSNSAENTSQLMATVQCARTKENKTAATPQPKWGGVYTFSIDGCAEERIRKTYPPVQLFEDLIMHEVLTDDVIKREYHDGNKLRCHYQGKYIKVYADAYKGNSSVDRLYYQINSDHSLTCMNQICTEHRGGR